ncbi:MAG: phosphoribosyltransferase family protein [Pirellulaceae bacterium]
MFAVARAAPVLALCEAFVGLIYPPFCAICQSGLDETNASDASDTLCADCLRDVRAIRHCIRCSAEIQPHWQEQGTGCPWCGHLKFRFDGAISLGNYEASLQAAALRSKTAAGVATTWGLGRALGTLVAQKYGPDYFDWIIPVPTHWLRRIRRGVSPADILARGIGKSIAARLSTRSIFARRSIRKQSTLRIADRRENVRDAYASANGLNFFGQRILVVDDLLTTGATASAIGRICRQAKAAEVHVAVVARTAPRFMTDE